MESSDQSLVEIQKLVVDSLPVGKRTVSSNGREFFSEYFVIVGNKARAANQGNVRYYAHVYVLGDRRPYIIEGLVRKEVRESSFSGKDVEYSAAGVDDELTSVLVQKLKAALTKSRGDLNIIDDFRVF